MSRTSFELRNEIVRAGAGAGKTTRLTQKVIEVALQTRELTGEFPKIGITTFTRKATQELRERLVIEACKTGDDELIDFVSSKSKLFISTIHGVLGRFLKSYGSMAGVDPNFKIISSSEADSIGKKVLREVLFSLSEDHLNDLLMTYSFNQVHSIVRDFYPHWMENPELEFATEEHFARSYQRFLMTVTNELRLKMRGFSGEIPHDCPWGEFLIKLEKVLIGILDQGKAVELPSSGDQIIHSIGPLPRVSGKAIDQVKEELKSFKKFYKDKFESRLSCPTLRPKNWLEHIQQSRLLEPVCSMFSRSFLKEKLNSGKLEMQDIELVSLYGIRSEPSMAGAFADDWDFWLIDEFQDTSPIQVNLLRSVVGSKKSFVVGDPQQSIYLFRGARSEVFSDKEVEIKSLGGDLSQLQRNWRSRPELLLFFNDVFSTLGDQFLPMEPREPVSNPQSIVAKIAIADEYSGEDYSKQHNEDLSIVDHIQDLLASGSDLDSICILGRTNKLLSELAVTLDKHGIPTHLHSASGFFSRREVLDCLIILKFCVNPHDNLNLISLLRTPWFRVSDDDLVEWCKELEESGSHWGHFRSVYQNNPVIEQLKQLQDRVQLSGFSQTLKAVLIEKGVIDASLAYDPTGRRESNIWKLLYLLRTEEELPGFNIIDFINQSSSAQRTEEGGEESDAVAAIEPNRVNLMTVHSSKGLQFEHVIIPRMDKGRSPGGQAPIAVFDERSGLWTVSIEYDQVMKPSFLGKQLIEEMTQRELLELERLLYVAMTRAKESIFLSWCGKPRKNSWAEMLQLDFSAGLHKTRSYSYEVRYGPWEGRMLQKATDQVSEVRPKLYDDFEEVAAETRRSVSSVLSEGGGDSGASKKSESSLITHMETLGFHKSDELLENSSELLGDSLKNSPRDVLRSLERASLGTTFHRALEILKYNPDFDFSRFFELWTPNEVVRANKAISFVRGIDSLPFQQLLSQGYAEWGFQLQTSSGLIEGQIDLWGEVKQDGDSHVWLIDYKSGSPKYKEKGFKQLGLYALALRDFGKTGPIHLALIYPFSEKVETRLFDFEQEIREKYHV